jgi:uncharacterized membrane protein YphA (DoxX/SURF4 family)
MKSELAAEAFRREPRAGRMAIGVLASLFPALACAHVKWFVDYNLLEPPRPPLSVVSSNYFVTFGLVVVPLMFLIALADRALTRRACFLHRTANRLTERTSPYFPQLLRIGVSVFFAAAFVYGCVGRSMILTPELHTHAEWVCWLQLALAILALSSRTAIATGFGIVFLYGYAIAEYGWFHMLDYPIFLGVAAFLILESAYHGRKRELAHSIMRICAGVTLLWASIEKWAFPEWSFMLMTQHPGMALGFNPEFYMVAAGYVEFCAAYLLITGLLSARASALLLLVLFLVAIMPFGRVDAVGHLVIIVVLLQLFLSDNSVGRRLDVRRGSAANATIHVTAFSVTLALFLAVYFAGYYASYPDDVRAAARASPAPLAAAQEAGKPSPSR